MSTIRVQATNGSWHSFDCSIVPGESPTTIRVPDLDGEWIIGPEGMIANVGGNDWRIYTLHPEDCARLCNPNAGEAQAYPAGRWTGGAK